MKASYSWLRTLVPQLPADGNVAAERLTFAGIEVEGLHAYGAGIGPCEVVAVVSVKPHPSKSGLRLVTVTRGAKGQQEVVCGAPNVPEPGGLVVLAPLGTHLPAKGMTIERRAIGGVVSEGMLCSEQELGLSEEGEGILVLPAGTAAPGTRLVEAVPEVQDTVLDINLTPNRPDGLGHRGLARELAALFALPWSPPAPGTAARVAEADARQLVSVTLEDGERCPHYFASVLVDGAVGPSPLWMRYRLSALGVRSISNLVDVTNLVMLEYGHPMHAFDLDKVRGQRIIVRRARKGETLVTLDGVPRTLDGDDLVICDGEGPVALAGIMGGGESEISASTRRVLLECAYFEPRGIRRASRRHGLHTESSHRFERGVDFGDTADALARATALVSDVAGAAAARGTVAAVAAPIAKRTVVLREGRMAALLGVEVPLDGAAAVLKRLGFEVQREEGAVGSGPGAAHGSGAALRCVVPTHRPDITREAEVIDEVARVRGLGEIPAVLPAVRASGPTGDQEGTARRVRAAAVGLGLSEAITFAFVAKEGLSRVGAPAPVVELQNPLTDAQRVMRTSLLPGLLEAVGRARRHGERDVGLFSVGRVYLAPGGEWPVHEPLRFGAVLSGERSGWLQKPAPVDVWDAKGVALGLLSRLGRTAGVRSFAPEERPVHLHPRAAAALVVDGRDVGSFGLLHPDAVEAFEVAKDTVVVEVAVDALGKLDGPVPRFVPLPRFPASPRDLSVVVRDDVAAGGVESAVRAAAGPLAERVEIFDRFTGATGAGLPEGHVSLTIRVVYRASDRTLTDAEVDGAHSRVVADVEKRFGATLRA